MSPVQNCSSLIRDIFASVGRNRDTSSIFRYVNGLYTYATWMTLNMFKVDFALQCYTWWASFLFLINLTRYTKVHELQSQNRYITLSIHDIFIQMQTDFHHILYEMSGRWNFTHLKLNSARCSNTSVYVFFCWGIKSACQSVEAPQYIPYFKVKLFVFQNHFSGLAKQNKKHLSHHGHLSISNLFYCRFKQQREYEIWPLRFGSFDTCFSLWES